MQPRIRQLLLFSPPVLVGALNLAHPMVHPPVYSEVLQHLDWWLRLHLINLLLFPLLGLAAYLLVQDVGNVAATVSRVAIAVFVPIYAAFDALMGIGTGTLVQISQMVPAEQRASAASVANAFYDSATLYAIAAAGSIAWVVAMLAAAVAFNPPQRRRWVAVVAVIIFMAGGWARTNLVQPDGMMTRAWWLMTVGMGLVMFAVSKPRITVTLLALAGALFGALHVPPTGPLGALCFLGGALSVELGKRRRAMAAQDSV